MVGSGLTRGWVRIARSGVLGGASLFLATAAHVVGGGVLPGAGLLALIGVGLALVSVTLTARRVRFGVLLAALAVEQGLLHLLFHAATTAVSCAPGAMPGHAMASAVFCDTGPGTYAAGGAPMTLAHLAAVVATSWLLARGDQWLWRVVLDLYRVAAARPSRPRRWRPSAPRRAGLALGGLGRSAAVPRGPPTA